MPSGAAPAGGVSGRAAGNLRVSCQPGDGVGGGVGGGSPADVRRGLALGDRQRTLSVLLPAFFLCRGSYLESEVIRQEPKDGKKISSLLSSCPSLKPTWVGEERGLTPSLGGLGRLLWIGRQAGTKKQAMATQAERNAPTHHTSRHPNGTFVPLMKEAETVRCG